MLSEIVDLKRYPIQQPDSSAFRDLVAKCRKELQVTGLSILEGFVAPQALAQMTKQAQAKESQTYYSTVTGNAYLKDNDSKLPADHTFNLMETTTVGVVAYDQISKEDIISQIYHSEAVLKFIGQAAQGRDIFYYECPLGKINYAMMKTGNYLRWHFDQSDFVASIPVVEPKGGGKYEYVRNIRSASNENFDEVRKVLKGDRSRVQILNTPPGSLILFEGRYTIHRVTPIEGDRTRIVALLGYADRPGVTSSEYLRKIRYGRIS